MDKLQNCLFVDVEQHAARDNVAVRNKAKRGGTREKRRQDERDGGGGELILARERDAADAATGARETREETKRRNGQTIEPLD